jgi:hypothetical protein
LEDILKIENKSSPNDQTNKTSIQSNKLDKASILRETAVYLRKNRDSKFSPFLFLYFFFFK